MASKILTGFVSAARRMMASGSILSNGTRVTLGIFTEYLRAHLVLAKGLSSEAKQIKPREQKMKSAKLDAKFSGVIFKVKDGTIVPDDEYMVFLAKDQAFLPTLKFYRDECMRLHADDEHIAAVERTIDRLIKWREDNQSRLKVPDAKGEKLVG